MYHTRVLVCWVLSLFALSAAGCVGQSCRQVCCTKPCLTRYNCQRRILVYDPIASRRALDVDPIRTVYNAVDCLLGQAPQTDPNRRILVASAVNLNEVENTSTFGRLTGEFLTTRLAHHGYTVVHLTVRQGSVVINKEGNFILSRDVEKLAQDYNAVAVLVSTYTLAMDKIYMSLKLVDATDSELLAAVDYAIPNGPRTLALLR